MAKQKVEKQSMPIVLDDKGNPKAIVFLNANRDRVIYLTQKADEDEIIELLDQKDES